MKPTDHDLACRSEQLHIVVTEVTVGSRTNVTEMSTAVARALNFTHTSLHGGRLSNNNIREKKIILVIHAP